MSGMGTPISMGRATAAGGDALQRQPAPTRIAGLTLAMLRYRVAIMVWTFMLLGAATGDGAPQCWRAGYRGLRAGVELRGCNNSERLG